MVINFISTNDERQNALLYGANGSGTVEEIIRNVFQQLLNSGDHKVGQAINCTHEIAHRNSESTITLTQRTQEEY